MSNTIDITLNSSVIKNYFEGKTNTPPVAEFMYIHTHLVERNFISEIEEIINKTAEKLIQNPALKSSIKDIENLAQQYAMHTNDINEKSASKILNILRDIYTLCMNVLGNSR